MWSNTWNDEEEEEEKELYFWLHGKAVKVDKICALESDFLRLSFNCPGTRHVWSLKIRSSVVEKALDFCKARGQIKITYTDDRDLLRHKLEEFDSDFLKHNLHDDDHHHAIALLDAACKMEIYSLLDLLFDPVVHMLARATPQDIEKIFPIRYNGDDNRFEKMNYIVDTAEWQLV